MVKAEGPRARPVSFAGTHAIVVVEKAHLHAPELARPAEPLDSTPACIAVSVRCDHFSDYLVHKVTATTMRVFEQIYASASRFGKVRQLAGMMVASEVWRGCRSCSSESRFHRGPSSGAANVIRTRHELAIARAGIHQERITKGAILPGGGAARPESRRCCLDPGCSCQKRVVSANRIARGEPGVMFVLLFALRKYRSSNTFSTLTCALTIAVTL